MEEVACVGGMADPDLGLAWGGFRITTAHGRIERIERHPPGGPWSGCIAVRGLVQPHVHLCQTLFRGLAEGRRLLEWLEERIWPLEAAHTPDTLATSVILSLREIIRSGCTSLLDMGSVEGSAVTVDILRRSGLRALAGNALMDSGPGILARDTGWLLEEIAAVRSACGGNVGHVLAPRFALSCSDELWAALAGMTGRPFRTTHCAESSDEIEGSRVAAAGGNVRFLADRGFLGDRTVLAHCVHLLPGEIGLLAGSGTAVAHCPWTNLRLGSGIADSLALMAAGVPVFPASDGAACNNALDLASDVRLAMSLVPLRHPPSSVKGADWLAACTSRASRMLFPGTSGRLEAGAEADLVFIEPSGTETEELRQASDPLRMLLELDWPARVRRVVASGSVVYEDGAFPTLPDPPMEAGEARALVLARSGLRAGAGEKG